MKQKLLVVSCAGLVGLAGTAMATITLDGQNIPGEGLTLRATQDTFTQFGDATGGGQNSGGSELNQLYGDISGGVLELGITGNVQDNFNKLWIFLDGVSGGENTLASDNVDGGFNEIQNMAGLSFDPGFTADHGLRIEIGGGFYGIRSFDLIDNTGGDVFTGGGPGDLPLSGLTGGFGVSFGWDNSNVLGVDAASAANAATATTGLEFSIDLATYFGSVPGSVGVSAFITSGDGTFMSNQVLPGIGGGGNIGDPTVATLGYVVIPEPASVALLGLGAALLLRRRYR